MLCTRLIAVVLWADGLVVQTRRFRITNAIGRAVPVVERLCAWGVDEIVLLSIRPGHDWFTDVAACRKVCNLPLAVGGNIHKFDMARRLFETGADMVVIRTNTQLILKIAERYGSQAVIQSIDVNVHGFTMASGSGQLLVNSLEHDGGRDGYDIAALQRFVESSGGRPVIGMGGACEPEHFVAGLRAGANAVAAGNVFHYKEHATRLIKRGMADAGYVVRETGL